MTQTTQQIETPEVPAEWRNALAEAALTISAFRWRLSSAGYPFREPPAVDKLISTIDGLLFPDPPRNRTPRAAKATATAPAP